MLKTGIQTPPHIQEEGIRKREVFIGEMPQKSRALKNKLPPHQKDTVSQCQKSSISAPLPCGECLDGSKKIAQV
jgi:hypothetical protein